MPMHACVSIGAVPMGARRVVLVHRVGISSCYRAPTAVRLAPTYRVFASDLPGFGESAKPPHVLHLREMADILRPWMECNHLHEAVLIRNSLGCQIISDLAVCCGSLVATEPLDNPVRARYTT